MLELDADKRFRLSLDTYKKLARVEAFGWFLHTECPFSPVPDYTKTQARNDRGCAEAWVTNYNALFHYQPMPSY
ncbi:hypothetical protein DPX16_22489 [Anabarilius grahami]|uniref:Uncharacterized protein n=1 Tax=Anabarilius grahami TaxID=495550 RepID=A0A3N0YZL3_ANAGA|nr:hypothetical protein DPX16_22489 [Anabarilius grahami]